LAWLKYDLIVSISSCQGWMGSLRDCAEGKRTIAMLTARDTVDDRVMGWMLGE
jgi:DNA-binding response OmpR family regulator